ncbi:hypothetical protein KA005_54870 [bacterium]|nr:hypothetical protein [bacterium]
MENFTEEQKKRQARLAGVTEAYKPEQKRISMHIDARLHNLFKAKVALENKGMGEIVEGLIDDYIGGVL